jgi:hypothetical protein
MSLEPFDFKTVTQHHGPHTAFLKRYKLAVGIAYQGSRKNYDRFCADLVAYAADERNLMSAADYVRNYGGTAPGPDGLQLSDFSRIELWAAVRALRDQLLSGRYKRGPLKRCRIDKHPGSPEKRTIYLAGILDRIVTRGATQVVTPLLAPVVDPQSFCSPRKGSLRALAFVQRRLVEEGRCVWIIEDARNAFDRVNRQRMLQILRRDVPNDAFCQLVLQLVEPPTRNGILQGSSLSMLLLDLFLTHLVHSPWRKENLPPLARYVDDVLVALRPGDDVAGIYERLTHLFNSAGMQPKHGYDKAVVDIRYQTAQWLGYRLRWRDGQLEMRSKWFDISNPDQAQQTHAYLFSKFAKLHDKEEGWRYQNSLLRGMIARLAPTLPFVSPEAIYKQIATSAREAGFEEIWSLPQVLERWTADHKRWQDLCDRIDDLVPGRKTPAFKDSMLELCPADAVCDPSVPPWEYCRNCNVCPSFEEAILKQTL